LTSARQGSGTGMLGKIEVKCQGVTGSQNRLLYSLWPCGVFVYCRVCWNSATQATPTSPTTKRAFCTR